MFGEGDHGELGSDGASVAEICDGAPLRRYHVPGRVGADGFPVETEIVRPTSVPAEAGGRCPPASVASSANVAALRRAAEVFSDLAQPDRWVVGDAYQDPGMVRYERPSRHAYQR